MITIPRKSYCSLRRLRAKPVHVSGGGVGKADWHMEFGGTGVGGEHVNEQKVGKHIGEIVLKVGL